jgi:hypothetical protein
LLAVLLAAALAPACLRVLSVAHTARWAGACLPSQGAQADAVRLGLQPHSQMPVGHHGGACDVCGVCPALGDGPLATATGLASFLAQVPHHVPIGQASVGTSGEWGDVAQARGPPLA